MNNRCLWCEDPIEDGKSYCDSNCEECYNLVIAYDKDNFNKIEGDKGGEG